MPKKNSSIFQDVESIAQVTLQWKQHLRIDINHQTICSVDLIACKY